MLKKALLIGINYYDTPQAELKGCINDVVNMRNMLIDAYGYEPQHITVLRDDALNVVDKPTTSNIMKQLSRIVAESASLAEIWIHYSGHGSQIRDTNGDESDRKDEVIVPSDYAQAGVISDDMIFKVIKQSKCPTMLLFDSCNSGTVCDLMWNFNVIDTTKVSVAKTNNTSISNPNIYCFSGCRDEQTSADIYNLASQQAGGAMTIAVMECLRMNRHIVDIKTLYIDVVAFMKRSELTQIPQLSSSSQVPTYKINRLLVANNTSRRVALIAMALRSTMKW
jgi:hypothetical protein